MLKLQQPPNSTLSFLVILIVVGVISLIFGPVNSQENESKTATSESIDFLIIQQANSGSISNINSTTHSLQLNDITKKVILFSERPNRIVLTESLDDFIGNWTIGQDSFQYDPPNAALILQTDNDSEQGIFEIELFNPKYNEGGNKVTYGFTILGNTTTVSDLPNTLPKSTLIIDSWKGFWKQVKHDVGSLG